MLLTALLLTSVTGINAQTASESSAESVRIEQVQLDGIQVWSRSNVQSLLDELGLRAGLQLPRETFRNRVDQAIERFYNEGMFSDIRARMREGTLIFEFE